MTNWAFFKIGWLRNFLEFIKWLAFFTSISYTYIAKSKIFPFLKQNSFSYKHLATLFKDSARGELLREAAAGLVDKELLVLSLLLHDRAGLVLGLGVVGQVVGAGGDGGGYQHLLKADKSLFVF